MIDDKSQNSHAGDRLIFKPTKWQKDLIEDLEDMKPYTVKIARSGKAAKLVSFISTLLNMTDPDELMAALDRLTDAQLVQYEKCLGKKMMFSTRHKFNYIHWYHRLFLWMFRIRQSTNDFKGVYSHIRYKVVFGNYFLVDEKSAKS